MRIPAIATDFVSLFGLVTAPFTMSHSHHEDLCECDLWLLTLVDTSTPTQEMTSHWPADIKLWITRVKDGGHQQRGRSIWRSSGGGLFKKGYYMIMGIWTKRWGALGRAGGEESTEKHWWAIFDKWRGSQHPSAPPSLVHLAGTCALHSSCTIPLSYFLLCPSQTRFLTLNMKFKAVQFY